MRKFRPLESKTPCENCSWYCPDKEFFGEVHCGFSKNGGSMTKFNVGSILRACKDYKEIEAKNSLFKKFLKFIGVGK